jgi:probable phosphoglycerate mutase
MRLFIVRHGESQSNAHWDHVKQPADLNSPLTDLGSQQAEKLAVWMQANIEQINLVFTSSLLRAEQTARPIADAYKLPLQIDHRLREGGYNYADGIPIPDDKLPMDKSVDFHKLPYQPFDPSMKNCESYGQLKERVAEFLDELLENHPDETIVVVTHGWTINAMFDVIFSGCSLRQCYFQVDNTAISYFEYRPEWKLGPWYAYFVAQTPHLPFYSEGIKFE